MGDVQGFNNEGGGKAFMEAVMAAMVRAAQKPAELGGGSVPARMGSDAIRSIAHAAYESVEQGGPGPVIEAARALHKKALEAEPLTMMVRYGTAREDIDNVAQQVGAALQNLGYDMGEGFAPAKKQERAR